MQNARFPLAWYRQQLAPRCFWRCLSFKHESVTISEMPRLFSLFQGNRSWWLHLGTGVRCIITVTGRSGKLAVLPMEVVAHWESDDQKPNNLFTGPKWLHWVTHCRIEKKEYVYPTAFKQLRNSRKHTLTSSLMYDKTWGWQDLEAIQFNSTHSTIFLRSYYLQNTRWGSAQWYMDERQVQASVVSQGP